MLLGSCRRLPPEEIHGTESRRPDRTTLEIQSEQASTGLTAPGPRTRLRQGFGAASQRTTTSGTMSDWDASRYHRVSEPQFDWGQRVIARLMPVAGERILDLGLRHGPA